MRALARRLNPRRWSRLLRLLVVNAVVLVATFTAALASALPRWEAERVAARPASITLPHTSQQLPLTRPTVHVYVSPHWVDLDPRGRISLAPARDLVTLDRGHFPLTGATRALDRLHFHALDFIHAQNATLDLDNPWHSGSEWREMWTWFIDASVPMETVWRLLKEVPRSHEFAVRAPNGVGVLTPTPLECSDTPHVSVTVFPTQFTVRWRTDLLSCYAYFDRYPAQVRIVRREGPDRGEGALQRWLATLPLSRSVPPPPVHLPTLHPESPDEPWIVEHNNHLIEDAYRHHAPRFRARGQIKVIVGGPGVSFGDLVETIFAVRESQPGACEEGWSDRALPGCLFPEFALGVSALLEAPHAPRLPRDCFGHPYMEGVR